MTPQFFTRPILSNIFKIFAYLFPTLIPFFSKNIGFSRGNTRYAVVSDLVIPILLQISFQNSPRHLMSLSVITCLGMPNFNIMWWKNNLAVPTSVQPIQSIFTLRASQQKCTLAHLEHVNKSRPMVHRAYGLATFKACGLSATFQVHWPTGFHISAWASTPASSGLASAYLYLDGHIKMDQNGSAKCTL